MRRTKRACCASASIRRPPDWVGVRCGASKRPSLEPLDGTRVILRLLRTVRPHMLRVLLTSLLTNRQLVKRVLRGHNKGLARPQGPDHWSYRFHRTALGRAGLAHRGDGDHELEISGANVQCIRSHCDGPWKPRGSFASNP